MIWCSFNPNARNTRKSATLYARTIQLTLSNRAPRQCVGIFNVMRGSPDDFTSQTVRNLTHSQSMKVDVRKNLGLSRAGNTQPSEQGSKSPGTLIAFDVAS